MGHSIGEVAAAHVAGVLSLADACTLVAARGRLMQALPSGGAMVAVQADANEAMPLLTSRVGIAAINGPSSVVLSGPEEDVNEIAERFREQGRKVSRLQVSHAFHSPLMEPMLEEFRQVLQGLVYHVPEIRVVSNRSGDTALADAFCSPDYWVRHVRETVRFADGVRFLESEGVHRFVELGPDGVLTALTESCLDRRGHLVVPVSLKQRSEPDALLVAIARLHTHGMRLDWTAFFAGLGLRRVDLPTYVFEKRRYWLHEPEGASGDPVAIGQRIGGHPLLSAVVPSPESDQVVLTGRLSIETHPWLADHDVLGTLVLPGTAYVELALRACEEVGCDFVEELTIEAMMPLQWTGGTAIQVIVGAADGQRPLSVHSRSEEAPAEVGWTRHVVGFVSVSAPEAPPKPDGIWPPPGAEPVDISSVYDYFASQGMLYGPMFQGLRRVWRHGDEVYAEVALPDGAGDQAARYRVHPALLDSVLTVGDFLGGQTPQETGTSLLPFAWRGVRLYGGGATRFRARLTPLGNDRLRVALSDGTGLPVASVESLLVRPVTPARVAEASLAAAGTRQRESMFRIGWNQLPLGVAGEAG
jgi:acyl transferase domain-containing protein